MDINLLSKKSKDEIRLTLQQKSHRAIFNLKTVDIAEEHVKLIEELLTTLKKEDIKWIEFPTRFEPIILPNVLTFPNKVNGNITCHIVDFEVFYFANINHIVKPDHIYYDSNLNNKNGWTVVSNLKQEKRLKHEKIMKELTTLYKQNTVV
ncbi:MAG: hypothetical protein Barrevirus3_8 [Barrevirus sp.]|uniref:Uncharacterized protein n=1 Tax=Barrevirus sp. TaxID=2487763 RepID=A0A3G4ZPR1_9VIRU|nr:MAG: hypothetical protein Barrevirus3_8 [Barrevirus sp.]